MKQEQIDNILKEHSMWLKDSLTGQRADLSYADLRHADLRYANLRNTNLRHADLRHADLRYANLRHANLYNADLRNADLSHADIYNADLSNANLLSAHLSSVNLTDAKLPSPTSVLLANWGKVSDSLTTELMRYDAANRPEGAKAFTRWAQGGTCPYADCDMSRAANFQERKDCWSRGTAKHAYHLMLVLFEEKEIKY